MGRAPEKRAVLIAGPTASGKSALALETARRLGGVVVNADAMQVYDVLRVLTARPSLDEFEGVPHRLYGFVAPSVRFSTGDWLRNVEEMLPGLDGGTPVFTGGTGLYFDALTRGFADVPSVPEDILREVEAELAGLYRDRGLSDELARKVARELTEGDTLRAHADAELQIDPDVLTDPWQAAGASFLAFAVGGLVPVLAILAPIAGWRVVACVAAVVIGLVVTGYVSARLGGAPHRAAIARNVGVGVLTMAITWGVGKITGSVI